jgi:hypothetical protein
LRMNCWNTLLMTRWWNSDKLKDRGHSGEGVGLTSKEH